MGTPHFRNRSEGATESESGRPALAQSSLCLCVFVPWWLILFSVPLCLCGENSVSWWCGLGDVLEMCHLLELFVAQLDFGEGEFLESIKREFLHTKTGHDRTEDDGLPNGWNITPVHTR